MFMIGKVTDEDRKTFDEPYLFSIRSRAKGDEEDGVYNEKGWRDLYAVVDLWNLLGSDKGQQLDRMMKEVESNRFEEGLFRLTLPQIERILELIDGLEAAVKPLIDENWHLRPEHVEEVRRKDPYADVVTSYQRSDGKMVYSLDETLSKALGAEWFLKHALRLGREIELG